MSVLSRYSQGDREEVASIDIDLGDAVLMVNLRVKGLRRYGIKIHVAVPQDTTPADRIIKPPPYFTGQGRPNVIMDLQADKKVALAVQFTDEVGNPVAAPEGAVTVWTVDDPTIIALTDNGDGTAEAAATGTLGTANVHADVTFDGIGVTGDLQLVVVPGLAERVAIVAGEPEEVTPDA